MAQLKDIKFKEEFQNWFFKEGNNDDEEWLCHLNNIEFATGFLIGRGLNVHAAIAQFVFKDKYEAFEQVEQALMNDPSKLGQNMVRNGRYTLGDSWNLYSSFIQEERENLFYQFINEQLEKGKDDQGISLSIQFEIIKYIL